MTRRQFFATFVATLMGIATGISKPEPKFVKSTFISGGIGCLNPGDVVTFSNVYWFSPRNQFRVTGVYMSDGTATLELV